MKIRICIVFLLFSTICYAAGWDELNRVQIEDTLGDRVGVTGNSLEVVEDNSGAIKDALELLDNAVAGNELQVDIVSGSSSSTEYTEADTDASITGIAIMWEDGSDTLRAVSATKPLPVDITDASIAVTGTFWQVTQPISGTVDITETSFDATQATATSLKAQVFGDDITSALDVDASGQLQVDILTMPSTTVTATDLDIRDLAVTTDDILIYANTAKDGSGTDYVPLVDADGNLQVDVLSAPTTAVTGTFYQVTQPISGDIGTLTTLTNPVGIKNAATDTITGISGTYDTIDVSLTNGTNRVTVDASGYLTSNINGTVTVDGTITSTPSGIQEIEGDEAEGAALPQPVLIGGDDGTDIKNIHVDASTGDVQVDVTNTVTVSGTVTANAGTNLNTSSLATSAAQLADGHNVTIDNAAAGAAVNIQDGGNAITVDGSVTVSGTATVTQAGAIDTELTTADLDVGAGTDTEAVVGLQIAKDGGAVLIGAGAAGDSMPINDDGGALTVDGSVTATLAASDGTDIGSVDILSIAVGDNNIGNVDIITVPAPLNIVGGGAEATALRVTIANDSTGLVSIDDGAGAITVDGSVTVSGTATVTQAGTVTVDLAGNNDVTVTSGAITETNSGDIEIAVQLIDDMIYVDDTAVHATGTTKGAGIMAAATPTDGSVAANDIGMVAMSVDRRLLIDAQIVGSDADINVEVTETEFDSNVTKLGGNAINVNGGAKDTGTQTTTLATDDPAVVALQIIDDWDDTNYANVNLNVAGTDVTAAEGVIDAQTLRVTVSTDDEINDDLEAIKTAIEKIDEDNISTTVATVYNVTMTNPDTEYSQALTNVESLMFQCREEFDMRYAFVTGKVATPTAPWFTLKSGAVYSENFYDGAVDFTLYFASDETGKIAEIEIK